MSKNFLKFKRRLGVIRTVRASLIGLAVGLAATGVWLILTKLAVIGFEPINSIYIGIGLALVSGGLVFLLSGRSDKSLAEELDEQFGLKARVQTMIAYQGEDGELVELQREDADSALSTVPLKAYKFKKLWINIVALILAASLLAGGLLVKDMRDYVPPEEVIPFELSELQREGLNELIRYVERSPMEEEYRVLIAEELRTLLSELENATTMPEMEVALAKSMAIICDITYRSSTAAEILNVLWDSDDIYLRYLAKALDTSNQSSSSWGDFAENMTEYAAILMGDGNEDEDALTGVAALKWSLESMNLKYDVALKSSGLDEGDELYLAIRNLFEANPGGLLVILGGIDYYDDDTASDMLNQSLNLNGTALYEAVALNKNNASTGEYVMTRLASLFLVPLPEFERPEFVKTGESVDPNKGDADDKENENGTNDGGIGEGATYGTDDMVLDPITGEYVKCSELIDRYFALMTEKLNNGSYTEDQKEAIRKYFDLLFAGLEKKEEGK